MRFSKRLQLSQNPTKLEEKSSREANNHNRGINISMTKTVGNVRERGDSRKGHKRQSKRWPQAVYLGDDQQQQQHPVGMWSCASLCKTKPSGFHMETGG